MTIHQTMLLLAGTCLLGGCTATLTPSGDIYAQAYLPAQNVVVESYTPNVVVESYTPTVVVPVAPPRPLGPVARGPRSHTPPPVVHRLDSKPSHMGNSRGNNSSHGKTGKPTHKPSGSQRRR